MKLIYGLLIFGAILLLTASTEARRKHKYKSSGAPKSKTKTKWSSSTYNSDPEPKTVLATEEHGYYIKRTFAPLNGQNSGAPALSSPPYLAIPIAWFSCDGDCVAGNSIAINGNANVIQDGFLCEDDCTGPYAPTCGQTSREVAVFYNKCKLNVAKCRTHGLWTDLDYEECKRRYAKEVEYTEQKFRSSPYFRLTSAAPEDEKKTQDEIVLEAAVEALNEISDKLDESEASQTEFDTETEGSDSNTETTTILNEIKN